MSRQVEAVLFVSYKSCWDCMVSTVKIAILGGLKLRSQCTTGTRMINGRGSPSLSLSEVGLYCHGTQACKHGVTAP